MIHTEMEIWVALKSMTRTCLGDPAYLEHVFELTLLRWVMMD
jgi:hypothetical protein